MLFPMFRSLALRASTLRQARNKRAFRAFMSLLCFFDMVDAGKKKKEKAMTVDGESIEVSDSTYKRGHKGPGESHFGKLGSMAAVCGLVRHHDLLRLLFLLRLLLLLLRQEKAPTTSKERLCEGAGEGPR